MESLKTILYFSIFRYSLTIEEIHSYTSHNELKGTKDDLDYLVRKNIITDIVGFYVYNGDIQSVTKRHKGNTGATKALVIAKKNKLSFTSTLVKRVLKETNYIFTINKLES